MATPWSKTHKRENHTFSFPLQMERVSPAPCGSACNRVEVDDLVGINSTEQYLDGYGKCIGCHIFADVYPAGYIDMGIGE